MGGCLSGGGPVGCGRIVGGALSLPEHTLSLCPHGVCLQVTPGWTNPSLACATDGQAGSPGPGPAGLPARGFSDRGVGEALGTGGGGACAALLMDFMPLS